MFGLIIAQATITGQFILKDARHEAYATIALMFLTYFFLRSTRARYDSTSSFLPLEIATVMDISLGHDEELKKQRREVRRTKHQESPEFAGVQKVVSEDDESLGNLIGTNDPFELAYLQPVLRASPHARPEQPFPPAQLGREGGFLLGSALRNTGGSTLGTIGEDDVYDESATVRVMYHDQNNRRALNHWWKNLIQQQDNQRLLHVLIGEECGTISCDTIPKAVPAEYGQYA